MHRIYKGRERIYACVDAGVSLSGCPLCAHRAVYIRDKAMVGLEVQHAQPTSLPGIFCCANIVSYPYCKVWEKRSISKTNR